MPIETGTTRNIHFLTFGHITGQLGRSGSTSHGGVRCDPGSAPSASPVVGGGGCSLAVGCYGRITRLRTRRTLRQTEVIGQEEPNTSPRCSGGVRHATLTSRVKDGTLLRLLGRLAQISSRSRPRRQFAGYSRTMGEPPFEHSGGERFWRMF